MKKAKAIRHLKSMRRDAEWHLLHDARDSDEAGIFALDIDALSAGIKALSARDPDRTGKFRRDSKMLKRILGEITDMAYKCDRPMFAAILDCWKKGQQAQTQVERVALDEYRKDMRMCAGPNYTSANREITARVALLMLEDVHPERKEEGPVEGGKR